MENTFSIHIRIGAALLLMFSTSCTSRPTQIYTPSEIRTLSVRIDRKETVALPEAPNLNDYILYALNKSTDLRKAFNLFMAARERGPQVSALPEPVLSYGYFINSIETRVGPMKHRVGLAQPIPWFGKLSLREDVANAEARAAYYAFLVRKNKLVSDVIAAYYELAFLREARSITDANLELLKRWEQVLAQRYRAQSGTQTDLIKVQVELGKLEDKLKELDDLEDPLRAKFNALLNLDINTAIIIKKDLLTAKQSEKSLQFVGVTREALQETMKQHNPEIKLLNTLVEAREKGINLARKDFYPDFSIGADYTFIGDFAPAGADSGNDGLATVFSINLPINFSQYSAGLREAKYRSRAAEQSLTSRTFDLKAQLARNLFDVSDSKRKINLFAHTLVPKAEEALESTFTAFEAGESSFLDLLDTERELLDFQLMLSRAEADLAIKTSELRALIGDYSETESQTKGETK